MKCKYCGAEITDDSEFCTNCGKRSENVIHQTKTTHIEEVNTISVAEKIKKFKIPIIVCCCAVLFIYIFTHTNKSSNKNEKSKNTSSSSVSKSEDKKDDFVENMINGDYSTAFEKLTFTNAPNDPDSDFSEFAENNLSSAAYSVDGDVIKISTGPNTYELKINSDGTINGDDLILSYKVKSLSALANYDSSAEIPGESEYEGNGMTVTQRYCYKTSDNKDSFDVTIAFDKDYLLKTGTAEVSFDEQGVPISVKTYNDNTGDEEDSGYAYVENGIVIVNEYAIGEDYSKKIAKTFSGMITDMIYDAMNDVDYNTFASNYSDYMVDNEKMEEMYNSFSVLKNGYVQYSYDCTAKEWTYPQNYYYGEDYIMEIEVELNQYYENGSNGKSSSQTYYVNFVPGENGFRVINYADTKSDAAVDNHFPDN